MTKPLGVLGGIAQTIDVVEPQTLQLIGGDQSRHQRMDGTKRRRILDPQAGEIVDVEEAPVVHRRESDAPICDAVMLTFEQAMQHPRAGFGLAAVGLEAALDRRCGAREIPQPPFEFRSFAIGG